MERLPKRGAAWPPTERMRAFLSLGIGKSIVIEPATHKDVLGPTEDATRLVGRRSATTSSAATIGQDKHNFLRFRLASRSPAYDIAGQAHLNGHRAPSAADFLPNADIQIDRPVNERASLLSGSVSSPIDVQQAATSPRG